MLNLKIKTKMQFKLNDYDANTQDLHYTLALPQPHAARIALGVRRIVLMLEPTEPVKDVLICATAYTSAPNLPVNTLLAKADLVECLPVKKLNEHQLDELGLLDRDERRLHELKYAYIFDNARRVIELPFLGKRGYYQTPWLKESIVEYPTEINATTHIAKK